MRHLAIMPFLAMMAVSVNGCDTSPLSPADEGAIGPEMSKAAAPSNPGMSPVERFGFDGEFASLDFARNLLAAYWDPDVLCAGGGFPILRGQEITLPQLQASVLHLKSEGPIPVTVFPLIETFIFMEGDWTPDEWCAYFTTQWLYRGAAVLRYQDNSGDASPFRMNSWGWAANGNVQDHDESTYRYLNQARFVVDLDEDPAVPPTVIHSSEVIRITPR